MTERREPVTPPQRRDRLLREHVHDTYKMRSKLPEPTVCPECGAVYHKGRWQWGAAEAGANQEKCPACHRTADRYPGGYVTLSGDFLAAHRDEIMHLARHVEEREKRAHPLRRIMDITQQDGSTLVTTTDMGLARDIGEAIEHAYKGELDYKYTDEANILEVKWKR